MNTLWTRWNSAGLATKQFIYLSLVTLSLFLILARLNHQEAEMLFKEQVARDAELLVARTNQYVDASLDNIENMLLVLSDRADLLSDGNEGEAVETLKKYVDYNRSIARTIYMVRADKKVYSSSQVLYDVIGNPHIDSLYKRVMENKGIIYVSEPYHSPVSGHTIAYGLLVRDRNQSVQGVSLIELNLEFLASRITPMIYQSFTLLTESGNVINRLEPGEALLPVVGGTYPPELPSGFIRQLADLRRGISAIEGESGTLMAVKSDRNRLGWSLIAFIQEEYFYRDLKALQNNYRTATLLWIAVLLVSSFILSRYFTKPIRRMVHRMDRVSDFEIVPKLAETRNDEIGRLARSYNAMLERISNLLHETRQAEEQKKEYELKMLRSQISPHFLYNTLACIGSLAKQGRIPEVRETIRSLVHLLSFSFDKQSEFVTVEEELEGLRRYMYIQQVRYGPQYEYTLDADPAVLSFRILKLTLQPLVENAIFHGMVPKGGGHVAVRARVEKGRLRIYVRDNGVGMPSSQRGRTLAHREQGKSPYRFTGIGINNVNERIRLHFGSSYGIRLGSLPGVGTVVRVDIPLPMVESKPSEG